jgi:competence protein ComEC
MVLFGAALAWIVGISVGIVRSEAEALLGGALLLFAAALLAPGGSRLRRLSLLCGLLLLGACRAASGSAAHSPSALHPLRDRPVELSGRVDEPPRCGPKSCRFVLEVERLVADGLESPLTVRVQVTTAARSDLRVGRTLVARGTLHAPRVTWGAPRADLLARRGIYETLDYPWLRIGPVIDLAPHQRFEQLRALLEQRLVETIGGAEGALTAGLLLGRDVRLPAQVIDDLRATGTGHILAVSGFNVALIGMGALGFARPLLGQRYGLAVALAVVAAYTMLVGAPPSALRAALMFGLVGLALAVGRQADALTGLALAASLMLALEPVLILDLGFQLSCAATAGLVLFGRSLTPTARWLPRWVTGAIGLTLAAEVLTLPIALATFHSASLVAPLANVAIAWTLPILTGLAFAVLRTSALPGLSMVVAGLTWLLSHYVLQVVSWCAMLPVASVSTGSLPSWALGVIYLLVFLPSAAVALARHLRRDPAERWGRLALVPTLLALVLVGYLASQRPGAAGDLRVEAFDAGGDGLTLAETPGGHRILLGSLESPFAVQALSDRLPFLDRGIDLLVLTRQTRGDDAGLTTLQRRFPVGLVLGPLARGSSGDQSESVDQNPVAPLTARVGQMVPIEEGLDLHIQAVTSGTEGPGTLVARLRHQQVDILVVGGGDAQPERNAGTTIIRLAPELVLGATRQRQSLAMDTPVVVVGGRSAESSRGALPQIRLDGTTIVEMRSDGNRASVERLNCGSDQATCRWP